MIKSMTGYGRCELSQEERKITVEIKSVNHRYCDINIRLPRKFSFFETKIRTLLKEYIDRGKVDVFITYEDYTDKNVCVSYNAALAKEYYEKLSIMADDLNIENDIRVSGLSRYPEVLTLEEQTIDEDELWELVETAVRDAAESFVETRITEGENLRLDMMNKLEDMEACLLFIEERSPEIVTEYREKLMTKVAELIGDTNVDEHVLVTEVTIYADKICTDEETVRLRSHIDGMKNTLNDKNDSVGRKLDFIAQEMNREANTILSKANDIDVSDKAINLKTNIEKIREQIQNIE